MFFKKLLLACAVTSVMLVTCISPVMAQQVTSSIVGRVLDPSGNPVGNATVVVTDTRINRSVTTATGNSGQFSVRGLEVGGPYSVQVNTDAFSDERVDDLFIGLSDTANLLFELEEDSADLGNLQVLGVADVRDFERAIGPGSTFGLEDINNLPSISRDIRDVIRNDPRVAVDESNSGQVLCLGSNGRNNSITVDGVRQDDGFGLNNSGFPGEQQQFALDAINQVSVEFAPFDVEYGNFSGCNINVVTKSGTNEITGGLFEYYTSDGLTGGGGDFDQHNFGGFVGGPIIKDRLFLFVSYDETLGSTGLSDAPNGLTGFNNISDEISVDDVNAIRDILLNVYNFDPGALPVNGLDTDNRRILARLDAYLSDEHRVAFNYQRTREDFVSPQNTFATGDTLAFSSNFFNSGNEIDSYSLRLFSNWTGNFSTEVRASFFENTDNQDSLNGTNFAEFNINLPIDATGVVDDDEGGRVVLGPDVFRQANDLFTETLQFKVKGTYSADNHDITFGYEYDNFDVFNLFVPFSTGEIIFDGLDALAAQDPTEIEFNGAVTGNINDATAIFDRTIHTFYVQDQWYLGGLTLQYGLRYDFYQSDDLPIENQQFIQRYGFSNAEQVLDGLDSLQPRVGFTYDAPWSDIGFTSFHGGVGIFSGGDPSVIFSNSFTNTGIVVDNVQLDDSSGLLGPGSIDGFNVPSFVTDQLTAGDGAVNAVDPDFELPEVLRINFGFQHDFHNGLAFSFDYVYSDAIDALNVQALHLAEIGTAPDGRPIFREVDFLDPDCLANPGDASICDARFTDDLLLTNADGGRSHNITVAVSKSFEDIGNTGIDFNTTVGYSFTDATDVNPITSSTATSNFANFSTANFNNPAVATANSETRHNAVFRGTLRKAFFGDYYSTINLFATIRSGRPFSYTFETSRSNNLFGDARDFEDRSLLYVPLENDPTVTFGPNFDLAAFNAFLAESGLDEFRGGIAPRNAFNSSTFTDLDIRFSQELPGFFEGDKITLFFDIENFLNLIDNDANVLSQIPFEFNNNVVEAQIDDTGNFFFDEFRSPIQESTIFAATNWQIQLGLRYDF